MVEVTDENRMWGHIMVEAKDNPTYAIAYAILTLADKVADLREAMAESSSAITTAIEGLTEELALKGMEAAWTVAPDGTVTKDG